MTRLEIVASGHLGQEGGVFIPNRRPVGPVHARIVEAIPVDSHASSNSVSTAIGSTRTSTASIFSVPLPGEAGVPSTSEIDQPFRKREDHMLSFLLHIGGKRQRRKERLGLAFGQIESLQHGPAIPICLRLNGMFEEEELSGPARLKNGVVCGRLGRATIRF